MSKTLADACTFAAAPAGYAAALAAPDGVVVSDDPTGTFDVIQVFLSTRTALEAELPRLKPLLAPDGKLWVTYPKGTSKTLTADIHRDDIHRYTATIGLQTVAQVSVDDDWSAIRCKVAGEG